MIPPYTFITNAEALGQVANDIADSDVVGVDLETTALHPAEGEIRLLSVKTRKNVYVIDLFKTKTLGPVIEALASESVIKILQNVKFDQKWLLEKFGLRLWPVFCTYRASVLIHNGKNGMEHNLDALYSRELGIFAGVEGQGKSDWSGSLDQKQKDYSAEDVNHLHALRDKLKPQLANNGLNKVALIEFGVCLAEAAIENKGIYLDAEMWTRLAEENLAKKKEVEALLYKELPNPSDQLALPGFAPSFNLDSPPQVLKALQKLGITEKVRDEQGKPTGKMQPISTTREIILAGYAAKYPVIKSLFSYREYSKAVSTYGIDYLKHINPITGRIHCGYFPFTGAGRYACSKPNIQQIPRGKAFRSCFRPRPGYKYVLADYAGIEMRIAAQVAPDPTLANVFSTGRDAHTNTAALLNGMAYDELAAKIAAGSAEHKLMRQQAKAVNFGLIYGMGAPKLVLYAQANYGVTLSLAQANGYRREYFENYSGIQRWHSRAIRDGKRERAARTLSGRRRFLDPNRTYSEWFNTPVQGTGADALKASLRNVYYRLLPMGEDAEIVHHVHDEIIVETRDDPEVVREVRCHLEEGMTESMEQFLHDVPVLVEASEGESWAEAK